MSDTLQEREWCDDCHGYTHMPYCPSSESAKEVSNQAATIPHQPAARGGGDETPERVWLTRKYGNRIWKPKAGVEAELQEYIRMDQHQSLVAERERWERLKSKIAWHRDGVGPDVPVLQERYDRVIKERNELREVLQLIQGFNWQLDDSPHGQEIKRRALELINEQRGTSE